MSAAHEIISALVAGGMDPIEAAALVARAAVEMTANGARSSNALRQQRYRDRNKTVTNRNAVTPDETVTNRNESVTNRNDVTPSPISSNKIDKKEKRGSQIPDGFRPDERRWSDAVRVFGSEGAEHELRKFTAHHGSKGTVFKNWQLGWDKWALQAQQWLPKPPASPPSHTPAADIDWRNVVSFYKKTGHWSKQAGPDPDSAACQAPIELLREFGILTTQ